MSEAKCPAAQRAICNALQLADMFAGQKDFKQFSKTERLAFDEFVRWLYTNLLNSIPNTDDPPVDKEVTKHE